jgi:hypothetical protein
MAVFRILIRIQSGQWIQSGLWIRNRILNPDPDPEGKNDPQKASSVAWTSFMEA